MIIAFFCIYIMFVTQIILRKQNDLKKKSLSFTDLATLLLAVLTLHTKQEGQGQLPLWSNIV